MKVERARRDIDKELAKSRYETEGVKVLLISDCTHEGVLQTDEVTTDADLDATRAKTDDVTHNSENISMFVIVITLTEEKDNKRETSKETSQFPAVTHWQERDGASNEVAMLDRNLIVAWNLEYYSPAGVMLRFFSDLI